MTISQRIADVQELRALMDVSWEHSLIGQALVGADNRFIAANPAFCRITDYTEFELQQKTFAEITLPEDITADLEMSNRVLNGECSSYDMIKHYVTKSRHVIRIALRVVAIRRADGTFEKYFSQISPAQEIAPLANKSSFTPDKKPLMSRTWLKDNWQIIAAIAGAIGTAISAALLLILNFSN